MSKKILTDMMVEMGLNPQSSIPLANEENQALLKELEDLNEDKKKEELIWEQINFRYDKLLSHQKLTNSRINHNLKLLDAYQRDVRRELNTLKLRQRISSKLKEDLKNIDRQYEEHKSYIETTENELCKRKQRVNDMTNRMKFAKMALMEWEKAIEDGENAHMLILKYFKEDSYRATQQEQRRQMLLNEIYKARSQLVQAYDEQKTLEQNLECTAGLYRTAHLERRQMVNTWKQSVQTMKQREQDIYQGEEQLQSTKKLQLRKAAILAEFDANLNSLNEQNRTIEEDIQQLNIETSEIKQTMQELNHLIILKENDVELMQKELNNLLSRIKQQRFENREHLKEKQKTLTEIETISAFIEKLKERSKIIHNGSTSAQERLQQLEEITNAEEKNKMLLNAEATRINNLLYKTQQNVTEFSNSAKTMEMGLYGLKQNITGVKRKLQCLETELKRKTELHYEISFKCLELERKVLRLQGGVSDPEIEANNLKILAQLEEQYTKDQKRLNATETKNKKLNDNMRKLFEVINTDIKRLLDMQFQVKESQSYCEGGLKQMKLQNHQNQAAIVELNILKMRAHEYEQEIESHENNTYNLQKHRLHLKRTIKDRIVEIKSQMDMLRLKVKHLNEEKAVLKADIGERKKQIEVVAARFELTTKLLGTNDDGTLRTATQLKVEAAQEKQCILEEGNALNAQVLKAEREIKALENSLLIMNNSNNEYRYTSCEQLKDAEGILELKNLKKTFCEKLGVLKNLRCKLLKLEQHMDASNRIKQELERNLKINESEKSDKIEILNKIQREIKDQQTKLLRAQRDLKRYMKVIQQRIFEKEYLDLFNKSLETRQLLETNSKILNQLANIVNSDEVMGPKIIKIFGKKGLEMPHLKKARSTSSRLQSASSELSIVSNEMSSYSETSEGSVYQLSSARLSVVSIDFPDNTSSEK